MIELVELIQKKRLHIRLPVRDNPEPPLEFKAKPKPLWRPTYVTMIISRNFVSTLHWLFCYAVEPDGHGFFWVWTHKPMGRGAKNGTAKLWGKAQHPVCFRTRSLARKHALKRCERRIVLEKKTFGVTDEIPQSKKRWD